MGRFTTPDWSAKPQAIPYSDPKNPQSFNLYQYEGNSPLVQADKDGHCWPFCTVAIGAAVGAGAGALGEYVSEKLRRDTVDGTKILHAAEGGAVAGAITGLAGPEAGLLVKLSTSVLGQVVGGGTERAANGQKVADGVEVAIDAAAGAVGAKIEGTAETTFESTLLKKAVPVGIELASDAGRRGSESDSKSDALPPQTRPNKDPDKDTH